MEKTMDKLWFIPPTDFVSNLNDDDRTSLLSLGNKKTFRKNELIFQAGSHGDHVYILLDGRAKIYQLAPKGKEVIMWFCFHGEMFGLAEVARGGSREVYARACSDSDIIRIRQDDFKAFLANNPHVALLTIDLLSCRLRVLGDMLINLTADDVTSRVIKLLTRLSARYGKRVGDDIYLDIPLTHQEIADMISTSRQTVSTIMGELKRKGVLRTENHCIHIQEPELLEHMIGDRNPDKVVSISNMKNKQTK